MGISVSVAKYQHAPTNEATKLETNPLSPTRPATARSGMSAWSAVARYDVP